MLEDLHVRDLALIEDAWLEFGPGFTVLTGETGAGKTLLVSSHVMDEASRCDRLVFVRDGAILADDTFENILADTGTDNADAAFLALTERSAA